ncbi:MAG: prepilin-type N-terminal cleavage/methylation domain-containing protein [Desulfotalea sp.]
MKHNSKGFTLIEVVVAMGVLSFGILAMFVMQSTGIRGNSKANQLTSDVLFASDLLEVIIAQDSSNPPFSDTDCSLGNLRANGVINEAYLSYFDGYTVACVITPNTPITGVFGVTINLTHNSNNAATVTLSSVKAIIAD